tara:strand:+ start:12521 stop:12907 length:387 start_codon:yes stop_codon:yes gene_type:complete
MQNSLKRKNNNLGNFNKSFQESLESEDYKSVFGAYFSDTDSVKDPNNNFNNKNKEMKQTTILDLSLGDIILELRDMFFILLELISKSKNPINYITSTSKRKYVFSIFLIVFGGLLLLLSNLMMEKNIL